MEEREFSIYYFNDLCEDRSTGDQAAKMAERYSRLSGYLRSGTEEEKLQPYEEVAALVLMSLMKPEVITLKEKEIEGGFAHLLYPELAPHSPAVRAKLHLDSSVNDLPASCLVLEVGQIRILFIMLMSEFDGSLKQEDAARAVERIWAGQEDTGVDLTLLFTKGGIEDNKKLAQLLPEGTGVDTIIGCRGGSQLEEIDVVGDILIVSHQETGTMGHLRLAVDMETHSIAEFGEGSIPMEDWLCPRDPAMDELFSKYQETRT